MTTEAERIAAGLTAADRRFLDLMDRGCAWHPAPLDGWRRSLRGGTLCRLGLFARMREANGPWRYHWTDLGREVAAALRAQEAEHG